MEATNIRSLLEDQRNLDIMNFFAKGMSCKEIAEKTEQELPLVEDFINHLRKMKITTFGRWNVDVNALGMSKTLEFRDFTEDSWNDIYERNFFLSYLSQIKMGKTKYLAMYTIPEEVEEKVGIEISSWYYSCPHFKDPFFKSVFTEENFFENYSEENNDNPLPPRGERIENPDLIDIYLCRYVQRELGDVNLKKYIEMMKGEIGNIIEVSEDEVEAHFKTLRDKNIIYPIVPLDFSKIFYTRIYSIISSEEVEIFRLMKALNKFNIITAISYMEGRKVVLLIQCPYESQEAITRILDQLDKENEMYQVTKVYANRGIPYKHYLKKFRKSQNSKNEG